MKPADEYHKWYDSRILLTQSVINIENTNLQPNPVQTNNSSSKIQLHTFWGQILDQSTNAETQQASRPDS